MREVDQDVHSRLGLATRLMSQIGSLLFSALLSLGSQATGPSSEGPKVLVSPVEIEGRLAVGSVSALQASVVRGLRRARVTIVQKQGKQESVGPTHSLLVSVEVDGRDYVLKFELRDLDQDQRGMEIVRECTLCGIAAVRALIEDQAASLGHKVLDEARKTVMLTIESQPSGAEVVVDGEIIGTTPFHDWVPSGAHSVEVSKRGYRSRQKNLSLMEGSREQLLMKLERRRRSSSGPRRNLQKGDGLADGEFRAVRSAGWISFTLGGIGLATGSALLILEGRPVKNQCAGDDIDINGLCRYRYTTARSGIAAMIGGGVVSSIGVALLFRGRRLRHQATETALSRTQFWFSPQGFGLRGRF